MRRPSDFSEHPEPFPADSGWYRAVGRYVVDGDTIDVLIDCGFNVYAYQPLRLLNVDTPELYRPVSDESLTRAKAARARVEELAGGGKPLMMRTYKDRQTFGRYVAEVRWWDGIQWRDLGQTLVEEGYAEAAP